MTTHKENREHKCPRFSLLAESKRDSKGDRSEGGPSHPFRVGSPRNRGFREGAKRRVQSRWVHTKMVGDIKVSDHFCYGRVVGIESAHPAWGIELTHALFQLLFVTSYPDYEGGDVPWVRVDTVETAEAGPSAVAGQAARAAASIWIPPELHAGNRWFPAFLCTEASMVPVIQPATAE